MKAFISYSHRDEPSLDRLTKHMSMLRRDGVIDDWYDREILPGGEFDEQIAAQIEKCELFLALVSADFLSSNYCYETEMQRALERNQVGEMHVIPIILRPCDWQASPLGRLKPLPKDGKPISEWINEDTAFLDVVMELRRLATPAQPVSKGNRRAGEKDEAAVLPKYRVKKDFDKIDREDFRDAGFKYLKRYFQDAIEELDSLEGIRARFRDLGSSSFSCTVVNQRMRRGDAHLTIHRGGGRMGIGDITYSFSEDAPSNTANGWLTIESDEYELFFQMNDFGGGVDCKRVSKEYAAELLWKEFVSHAGIDHA